METFGSGFKTGTHALKNQDFGNCTTKTCKIFCYSMHKSRL